MNTTEVVNLVCETVTALQNSGALPKTRKRSRLFRFGLRLPAKIVASLVYPLPHLMLTLAGVLVLGHPMIGPLAKDWLASGAQTPIGWLAGACDAVAAWPVWAACRDQWVGVILGTGLLGRAAGKLIRRRRKTT